MMPSVVLHYRLTARWVPALNDRDLLVPDYRPWRNHYYALSFVIIVVLVTVRAAIVTLMVMHDYDVLLYMAVFYHLHWNTHRVAYRCMLATAQQRRSGQQRNK
jgi:hypothetical protein